MGHLVAVAAHVRDPAERTAIGHADGEWLGRAGHARSKERSRLQDLPEVVTEVLLGPRGGGVRIIDEAGRQGDAHVSNCLRVSPAHRTRCDGPNGWRAPLA